MSSPISIEGIYELLQATFQKKEDHIDDPLPILSRFKERVRGFLKSRLEHNTRLLLEDPMDTKALTLSKSKTKELKEQEQHLLDDHNRLKGPCGPFIELDQSYVPDWTFFSSTSYSEDLSLLYYTLSTSSPTDWVEKMEEALKRVVTHPLFTRECQQTELFSVRAACAIDAWGALYTQYRRIHTLFLSISGRVGSISFQPHHPCTQDCASIVKICTHPTFVRIAVCMDTTWRLGYAELDELYHQLQDLLANTPKDKIPTERSWDIPWHYTPAPHHKKESYRVHQERSWARAIATMNIRGQLYKLEIDPNESSMDPHGHFGDEYASFSSLFTPLLWPPVRIRHVWETVVAYLKKEVDSPTFLISKHPVRWAPPYTAASYDRGLQSAELKYLQEHLLQPILPEWVQTDLVTHGLGWAADEKALYLLSSRPSPSSIPLPPLESSSPLPMEQKQMEETSDASSATEELTLEPRETREESHKRQKMLEESAELSFEASYQPPGDGLLLDSQSAILYFQATLGAEQRRRKRDGL